MGRERAGAGRSPAGPLGIAATPGTFLAGRPCDANAPLGEAGESHGFQAVSVMGVSGGRAQSTPLAASLARSDSRSKGFIT
jgi:hypothetical protein